MREPWTVQSIRPRLATKAAYREWCLQSNLAHCFYSGYVAHQPTLRVSELNPPQLMTHLVLDFDMEPQGDAMAQVVAASRPGLVPTWITRTFSGNARVIFEFARPITVFTLELHKVLMKLMLRELHAANMLRGLDVEAAMDPSRTYELGTNWERIPQGAPIESRWISGWMDRILPDYNWGNEGVSIPMTDLRVEASLRFGERWPGGWDRFDVSARGPRFWDESASDPTAAIVRETGMQYFSDGGGFRTWEAIFGADYVRGWNDRRIGNAIEDTFFDGTRYWYKQLNGLWVDRARNDMELELAVRRNMSRKPNKDGLSECDHAIHTIQSLNSVKAAMPFPFRDDGAMTFNGDRYLNISRVQVAQPAEAVITQFGDRFPWIAEFLTTLFNPDEQLDYFLTWVWHFYIHALQHDPRRGLALFLAGPPGAGKTVLNKAILGQIFGKRQDAGQYLTGADKFNANLFAAPLWTLDDEIAPNDPRQRSVFSQMVKRIVANDSFTYRAMHREGSDLPWIGRIVVTLNDDPESLRVLPEVEVNILDKIMLLRVQRPTVDWWPSDVEISRELPFFCSFLRQWTPPAACLPPRSDSRFGVVPYRHADLVEASMAISVTSSFEELLHAWRRDHFGPGGPGANLPAWEGTATDLFSIIQLNEGLKAIMDRNYSNVTSIGMHMNKLMKRGLPWISSPRSRTYAIAR